MRRIGILLLVIGLIGFVVASSQRGSYSVEGALKSTFSSLGRARQEGRVGDRPLVRRRRGHGASS